MDSLTRQQLADMVLKNLFQASSISAPLPIERLSERAKRTLAHENITTYAELASRTAREIEYIPGTGKATLLELETLLAQKDLKFSPPNYKNRTVHEPMAPTVEPMSGAVFKFGSLRDAVRFQLQALDAYKHHIGPGNWQPEHHHAVRLLPAGHSPSSHDVFIDDALLQVLAVSAPTIQRDAGRDR